jgi:hypothetical protein
MLFPPRAMYPNGRHPLAAGLLISGFSHRHHRLCERSEAIQQRRVFQRHTALGHFAPLVMTEKALFAGFNRKPEAASHPVPKPGAAR